MSEKYEEIKRAWGRAIREGYELHLKASSLQYYLDAIEEVKPVWQQIETAPKDTAIGYLLGNEQCSGEGYFNISEQKWKFLSRDIQTSSFNHVTHWMSLPQPPTEEK